MIPEQVIYESDMNVIFKDEQIKIEYLQSIIETQRKELIKLRKELRENER